MIRVLIAEDQGMVRGALASLLTLEPDIEVVAQVPRGDEVVAAALAAEPDIALLDIEMPGATGLEASAGGAGGLTRVHHRGRARERAASLAGNGAKPSLLGDAEARRPESSRGAQPRRGVGLAVRRLKTR